MRQYFVRPALAAVLTLSLACASGGAGPQTPATGAPEPNAAGVAVTTDAPWPVKTREHVDLWLHGFAMVQADTTYVPYFKRGYRDRMVVLKNQQNIATLLDRNADSLRTRFAQNRQLTGAQFLALYFGSWDDMRRFADLFIQANGDPRRSSSQEAAQGIALFAASFPTQRDRDWLVTFMRSVDDERTKFYHNYWIEQQRQRASTLAAVDSTWQKVARPAMQRFLNNTQQPTGDFIVSLPLDGEGRTIKGSKRENLVAVTYPERPADAAEAVYVFAHEVVGQLAADAINDNTTPTDKRNGVADRMTSAGAVRAGLILLERTAPTLADGYARYYLRSANRAVPSGDARAALAASFPLPDPIRDAITRQLDVVLGGI